MQVFIKILISLTLIPQLFARYCNNEFFNAISSEACEDFYEYACANYNQENNNVNYTEITQKLDYAMNLRVLKHLNKALLMRTHNSNMKQNYYDKMLLYWQSCTTQSVRNLTKYFIELKPSAKLNWPLFKHHKQQQWLTTTTSNEFDYWALLGQMHSYGFNNFIINYEITRNANNSLNIWLAPGFIGQQQSSLPHRNVLMVLLHGLGMEELAEVTLFIQQLNETDLLWQQIVANYTESTDQLQETNLENLPANLQMYLTTLLGPELQQVLSVTVDNPEYFDYLQQKVWSLEELEQLGNYFMLKFLFYLAVDSTEDFTFMECVKDIRNKFDYAINHFAYYYFFNIQAPGIRAALAKVANKIKSSMAAHFDENYLNLSPEQINYLKNKLQAVKVNLGNLPTVSNYHTLQKFYQQVPNLDEENYYKNHLLMLQHRFRNSLIYTRNQSYFIVTDNSIGSQSSPFYVASQNMVVIPLASLQLPLYHYQQTLVQQFSLLGFVLAHELTHAFDSNGLNYDDEGFLMPSLNNITTQEHFKQALDCLENPEPTAELDERLADLVSLRVAYRAYLDVYGGKQNFHRNRQFFLNLAQFFCGKNNLKFIDHDADSTRLQFIVKNFEPFSRMFSCPIGSPMNPQLKCRVY